MIQKVLLAGFLMTSLSAMAQKDPVILQVSGEKIKKSEFLQIYLKNNPAPKYDKASLDEYMELFKKFKLKVAEAEALGYDTIPKLKREYEGYRKQLALPYLIDSAQNDALVKEAYDRINKEVRCSHIMVKLEPNASPADTLAAYNRIMGLRARIVKGEDFASVGKMKNGSDDPSVMSNGGDLGYFTAFQMVYQFEDMAYKTPIGSISDPFRTKFGYHILKTTDMRNSRGSIKVAHLMVAVAKDADQSTRDNAEKKINEIYTKLLEGSKWEEMVGNNSDDAGTSKKGGELPMFGSGTTQRMVPDFEDAAFGIPNDGEYSKPVKTNFGYHIIKRLERKEVASFEVLKKEMQTKVNKDERSKKTQDSFVRKLKSKYNYVSSMEGNLTWFESNLDSSYYLGKWSASTLKSNKPLFTMDGVPFGQKQFASYLEKNYRNIKRDDAKKVIALQYKNWEKTAILDYEERILPAKYPDYKNLIKEYHDGILLYEVMSDKVWNKAVKDTAGLRAYYNAHKDKYMWTARIEATVYECLNGGIATEVSKMIGNDTINSKHVLDKVNKDSELNLKVKMNKFDPEVTSFMKGQNIQLGINKPYEFEGKVYVIKVTQKLPVMVKAFNEAKGACTSDYQNDLEAEWLKSLKKKYKIKVNSKVLYSLGQ